MDPGSRRVVWEILRELRQQKKSIIFTTHHLDEAEELADRIAVLSTGKVLILDTVENVKRKFLFKPYLRVLRVYKTIKKSSRVFSNNTFLLFVGL